MSKRLLSTALVAGLGVAAFAANAAQPGTGLINIGGKITSASCSISVNGSGNSNATVTLPTVQTSDLGADGIATGYTAVTIALSGCVAGTDTPALTSVRPYFEQGPTTDLVTGFLKNAVGGGNATNVEVMLSKTADTTGKLDLSKGPGAQGVDAVAFSGTPTFTYYAAYIAKGGAASSGSVSTSVQYTLDYL